MTNKEIVASRLKNQQLSSISFTDPADVVQWFGAVQSQDYSGAKWALAMRLNNIDERTIDMAFDEGLILRTHVLRPTWHFVLPDDIRWMLELTEPRITSFSAKQFRDLELTSKVLNRTNDIITRELMQKEFLTRKELESALKKARINTDGLRLTFMIFRAEIDRLICSGPRRGKQFTYALLDERAPNSKSLKKDEALSAIALRYFSSHGPATIKDFSWWSGLSPSDARRAVEIARPDSSSSQNGETYYFSSSSSNRSIIKNSTVHLLPAWDEFTVAYKDRSLVLDPEFHDESGSGIFNQNILIGGKIKGGWRREFKSNAVLVETRYYGSPGNSDVKGVAAAARRYAKYVGNQLVLGTR